MSTQPTANPAVSLFPSSAKVTVLSTDSGGASTSSAAATAAASLQQQQQQQLGNPRRKVGTNFERAFEQPAGPSGAFQQQQPGSSRPVLKAGKAVSSAPVPGPSRPMTELEQAFASRSAQDQRWLLNFPLAMKQLYFSFAESPDHDKILTSLINRFPELLARGQSSLPAIQVAIERGNWLPAMRFISACAAGPQIGLLRETCGIDRRTYPILAIERFAAGQTDKDCGSDLGRQVICSLFKACPDLLTAGDAGGRNPMHHCALHCTAQNSQLLLQLLRDIRELCLAATEVAKHLGRALVARDANGCQADEVAATECCEALRQMRAEFPDFPEANVEARGVLAIDYLKAALAERGKTDAYISRLSQLIRDSRMSLVPDLEDPVTAVVGWFGTTHRQELRQALVDIGLPDLCDRL